MVHHTSKTQKICLGLSALLLLGALPDLPSANPSTSPSATPSDVSVWCKDVKSVLKSFHWSIDPCEEEILRQAELKVGGTSVLGKPLIYFEFNGGSYEDTTLVFAMVHSDEITPFYVGIQLLKWLKANPDVLRKHRVIIAPLVNPDGLFRKSKTRTNARGVDLNRNFATRDWDADALRMWKRKYRSDRRRFPGNKPESEPETVFQRKLIEEFKPNKILSIHSPLSLMDYDGPDHGLSLAQFMSEYGSEVLKLKKQLKNLSFQFYPGSLGNYAGRELGIPTVTLELPSTNPALAPKYWKQFEHGFRAFVQYPVFKQ